MRTLLPILAFGISSCADNQPFMEQRLDLWIGQSSKLVSQKWGPIKKGSRTGDVIYPILSRSLQRDIRLGRPGNLGDDEDGPHGLDKDTIPYVQQALGEVCFVTLELDGDDRVSSYAYTGKCDSTLIPIPNGPDYEADA